MRPRLRPPGVALDPQRQAEGFEGLALQHFYRTAAFLSDVRGDLERELLFRDRDLFSQSVDVVFLDTTSLYVYRDSETPMRRWGCSRDRRGDLPQFVLCVVVDGVGWPIAWEILPGNTADPVATHHVVVKRRERFDIRSAVVVADRGTISKATVAMLGDHASAPFQYVLGCRMRRSREIRSEVLTVDLDGQRSRLHTDFKGAANAAFAAAGVRVPSAVTHLGTIPPPAADPQAEAAV